MKKILFIEDESALQKTMEDILKGEKYEVLSSMNGESGIATAKSKNPDLIDLSKNWWNQIPKPSFVQD